MIKEVRHSYFVSWAYQVANTPFAVGNTVCATSEKIRTREQINGLEETVKQAIEQTRGFDVEVVCITNITYLGEVEE